MAPDLKKLITGFLILAATVSTSALLFTNLIPSAPTNLPTLQLTQATNSGVVPQIEKNAATESIS